jgi:hypothetical protein
VGLAAAAHRGRRAGAGGCRPSPGGTQRSDVPGAAARAWSAEDEGPGAQQVHSSPRSSLHAPLPHRRLRPRTGARPRRPGLNVPPVEIGPTSLGPGGRRSACDLPPQPRYRPRTLHRVPPRDFPGSTDPRFGHRRGAGDPAPMPPLALGAGRTVGQVGAAGAHTHGAQGGRSASSPPGASRANPQPTRRRFGEIQRIWGAFHVKHAYRAYAHAAAWRGGADFLPRFEPPDPPSTRSMVGFGDLTGPHAATRACGRCAVEDTRRPRLRLTPALPEAAAIADGEVAPSRRRRERDHRVTGPAPPPRPALRLGPC